MTISDPSSPSAPESWGDPAYKQLRNLVHSIAIALLILTGTVFVFLYRQVVLVRRQTSEMAQYLTDYERSNARELIRQMQQKFGEFRKQNPDFTPIYVRYFGTNEPAAPPVENSSRITPAPVTNGPAKVNR